MYYYSPMDKTYYEGTLFFDASRIENERFMLPFFTTNDDVKIKDVEFYDGDNKKIDFDVSLYVNELDNLDYASFIEA